MRYGMMNFPVKPVLEEIQRAASLALDYVELAWTAWIAFSKERRNWGSSCVSKKMNVTSVTESHCVL